MGFYMQKIPQEKKTHIKIPKTEKESFLEFASILLSDASALDDLKLFFDTPQKYYQKYRAQMRLNRGIESVDKIIEKPAIVLSDVLNRHGALIYMDWKDDLELYLEDENLLQNFNNKMLKDVQCLKELRKDGFEEYYTIGDLVDTRALRKKSDILRCINHSGYLLYVIDEGTDGYPLGVVPREKREKIRNAIKGSSLKIYFLD